MHPHNIKRFIQECLVIEEDTDEGMDFATVYGLYSAWCDLGQVAPAPGDTFHALLAGEGIRPSHPHKHNAFFAGLWMVGPAARAYVLCSSFTYPVSQERQAATAA